MVDKQTNNAIKDRVGELIEKGQLLPEQQDGLNKMISSPDTENGELAKEIIKLNTKDVLTSGLNNDQIAAFESILEFMDSDAYDAFVLKGYAGTGKTFLVKRIIEYIVSTYPKVKIAITAPTNKAVRVLEVDNPFDPDNTSKAVFKDTFGGRNRVSYSTIHKLLGLKEQISATGVQSFVEDKKSDSNIKDYSFLIVDEVSMLDDDICRMVMRHTDTVNIMFMGDPAQIPPVKRVDSIPLRKQNEYTFKVGVLKQIMRQTGEHPVVDASFLLRNNLSVNQPIPTLKTNLNKEGKGIIFINAENEKNTIPGILKQYFNAPEFDANPDYAKVIAWSNDRVNFFNKLIRQIRYGKEALLFEVGEKLVANKPIFEEKIDKFWGGGRWTPALTTSDEMEVTDVSIVNKKFVEGSHRFYAKTYELTVKVWDIVARKLDEKTIYVIHEDSLVEYNELLEKAKELAKMAKNNSAWVSYFNIQKWSANVGYNYAITAHKAQGSTYRTVLLDEENIDKNKNVLERNRIKYTAYSRPTDILFVLRKNYE
jgi:hypothetical protein